MESQIDTRIPAVIAGFALNGLGVARSLAVRGIRCWILYDDPLDPCLATRCAAKIRIRDSGLESLITGLRHVNDRTGKRPVLFLTNDEQVETVSRHRDRFQDLARITLPGDQVVQDLLNKSTCRRLFEQAGLRQPKTLHIASADQNYGQRLDALRMPCIVKAGVKPRGYLQEFEKAYVVDSAEKASAVIRQLAPKIPDIVVQEWIDGPDDDIFFVLGAFGANSEPLALFAGQKLGSCPPRFGTTAACIPTGSQAGRIEDQTAMFFRTMNFQGLASLEFKRDRRSDEYYVIEPTVLRTDFQSEIAPLNGVDIPLIHYCFETGQHCFESDRRHDKPTAHKGRGWYDPASVSKLPPALRKRIRILARQAPLHNAYWSWRDPGPYLKLHARRLTGLGRRLVRLLR